MTEKEFQLKKAREYEQEGKTLHAIQLYTRLLASPDDKRISSIRLASLYETIDRKDAAINVLRNFLSDNTEDDEVRKFLCNFLIRNSYFHEALEELSNLSTKEHPEVNFLAGIINYNIHEFEIARINFDDFVHKNRHSDLLPDAFLYLARIYLQLKNHDKALESVKKSEKLFSQNHELYLLYAMIHYEKGMYFHANDYIQKAIKFNSKDIQLHEWAGRILLKTGDFEKAETHFKKVIKQNTSDPEIYTLLASVYLSAKKLKEAENYFNKALKINPSYQAALDGKQKCNYAESER